MRKFLLIIWISVLCVATTAAQNTSRVVRVFDDNWKFSPVDIKEASGFDFDDSTWRLLDLPHDWSIEGTISREAPAGGSGGYYPGRKNTGKSHPHCLIRRNERCIS